MQMVLWLFCLIFSKNEIWILRHLTSKICNRGLVVYMREKIGVGFISAAKTLMFVPFLWESVGN